MVETWMDRPSVCLKRVVTREGVGKGGTVGLTLESYAPVPGLDDRHTTAQYPRASVIATRYSLLRS
jgi:hypothetical protein